MQNASSSRDEQQHELVRHQVKLIVEYPGGTFLPLHSRMAGLCRQSEEIL